MTLTYRPLSAWLCLVLSTWSAPSGAQPEPTKAQLEPTKAQLEPTKAQLEPVEQPATALDALNAAIAPLKVGMFVDAYGVWQTNDPGTLATLSGHRAFAGQGANLRSENGLAVAFIGFDASYDTRNFGAVVNLRFGQAAALFHTLTLKQGANDIGYGIDHFTQAYVLWRPVAPLELDVGMFLSPFGAESLESFKNPNYTLSALYTYGQPSWHTGVKANWQITDALSVMALVANGSNNISEAQQNSGLAQAPNVGAAFALEPNEVLSFSLGGLLAVDPKRNDDDGIDAFADFVSTLKFGDFTTTLNADYIGTRDGTPSGKDRHFFGGSLTASYRLLENLGLAARGEYLRDDADFGGGNIWHLVTGTLTLDIEPIPHVPNLIVRWENRWERSNQRIYGKDSRGTADTEDDLYRRSWFESVLSTVVTTAP